MIKTYEDLHTWLDKFPAGRHISNQLKKLIEPGKELGYIPFDESFNSDPLNISFILIDTQKFIDVTFTINDAKYDESNFRFSIRKNQDLVKKDIAYSQLNNYSHTFKDLDIKLAFKDGYEISLSSKQFKEAPSNFIDFVNSLLNL